MSENLTETEARIVGALVEKQLTTPEYYPLTLNALIAACNQKTNREPVVSYDERTVSNALEDLRDKNIVYVFYGSTSRVPKYKHMLPQFYELEPSETAVLCVLMLRGPQTIGEIKERTGRLYDFRDLNDTNETLEALLKRDEPLIVRLERQPGQKEARYAHLLCGEVTSYTPPERVSRGTASDERFEKLEQELESLKIELSAFKQEFVEFKKQFE
ncbi:MAG: YceH family protein [Actinomycetota bacterium]